MSDTAQKLAKLTPEQIDKLSGYVYANEYNPEHEDDTFNAGWRGVFGIYDETEQDELIAKAIA